jgi:hypothetical protein
VLAINQCSSSGYCAFNEMYRWEGSQNWDGQQHMLQVNDTVFAAVNYVNNSYSMSIRVTGRTKLFWSETLPQQWLKPSYTNVYFVAEHHSACAALPPSNQLAFQNVRVFCEGNLQWNPSWSTHAGANPICNMQASAYSSTEIRLNWNSQA